MKKNVIYMFADQLAAFPLKLYGGQWIETPNIDRLAAQGTVFDNSISTFPICSPYRAMLMTGRYPQTTGHIVNHLCSRHDEIGIADAFAHAGYRTGYVGKWHLHRGSFPDSMACDWVPEGRARLGWQYWRAYNQHMIYWNGPIHVGDWLRDPTEPGMPEDYPHWEGYETDGLFHYAEEFIAENKDHPFLLMLSPHPPHFTPQAFAPEKYYERLPETLELPPNVEEEHKDATRDMLRHYLAMVLAIDEMLGNVLDLLDRTGLAESTYLVFTSDHGSQFGLHGKSPWQKQAPYEESLKVPFIIRGPGIPVGERADALLSPVDMMPTLCSLCSVPVPRTVEGVDLSAVCLGQDDAPEQDALLTMNFSNAYGYLKEGRQWRGIRTKTHSYVHHFDGRRELYNLEQDSSQLNNLVNDLDSEEQQEQLEECLQSKLAERGDTFCECRALRHWFDSDRRIVANAFGPLPHPESEPDWANLKPVK